MKVFVITGAILLIGMFAISPAFASFTDSMLVQVSGEIKKVYYNEKNVTSVLFDPNSASVIFETGSNAILEIKAPKVYKIGPNLFILKNGEEVAPEIKSEDDCFYYLSMESKTPETIEVAFTYWPEYPETVENCETFEVTPLKQTALGIPFDEIQCRQNLVLVKKYDGSPACVTEQTKQKLIERGWINSTKIQELIKRLEYNPHESLEVLPNDAKFIEQLALRDSTVANFVSEIEWKTECCKDTFMVETQEYEISITFQRLDKDSHLRVIFDRDTLEIMDITNDRYIRHTPITP